MLGAKLWWEQQLCLKSTRGQARFPQPGRTTAASQHKGGLDTCMCGLFLNRPVSCRKPLISQSSPPPTASYETTSMLSAARLDDRDGCFPSSGLPACLSVCVCAHVCVPVSWAAFISCVRQCSNTYADKATGVLLKVYVGHFFFIQLQNTVNYKTTGSPGGEQLGAWEPFSSEGNAVSLRQYTHILELPTQWKSHLLGMGIESNNNFLATYLPQHSEPCPIKQCFHGDIRRRRGSAAGAAFVNAWPTDYSAG